MKICRRLGQKRGQYASSCQIAKSYDEDRVDEGLLQWDRLEKKKIEEVTSRCGWSGSGCRASRIGTRRGGPPQGRSSTTYGARGYTQHVGGQVRLGRRGVGVRPPTTPVKCRRAYGAGRAE